MTEGRLLHELVNKSDDYTVSTFSESIGRASKTVYTWFKKDVIPVDVLILFSSCFYFDLSEFKNGEHVEALMNHKNASAPKAVSFIPFSSNDNESYEKRVEHYFTEIELCLEKAEKTISIYDHLEKAINSNPSNIDEYLVRRKLYFKNIQNIVENKDEIEYRRILVLPSEVDIALGFKECLIELIKLIPPSLFQHFCICFRDFPDRLKLFVLARPTKSYSYGLIDDKRLMLEYDRHDENRVSHLDLMFIHSKVDNDELDKNSALDVFTKKYHNLYSQGMKGNSPIIWRIEKNMWINGVYLAQEELEKETKYLTHEMEQLENSNLAGLDNEQRLKLLEKQKVTRSAHHDLQKRNKWMNHKSRKLDSILLSPVK